MDVATREKEIAKWDSLDEVTRKETSRPEILVLGQTFDKDYQLPRKAIFWTKGIKQDSDGQSFGSGMLSLELVLLDRLGFDLDKNAYAMNETLRILIRTIIPFLIMIVIAMLMKPEQSKRLDMFFVKMKTPVDTDHDEDVRQLKLSYEDPHRFDHKKLFSNSSWEFDKWTKVDVIGFIISTVVAVSVIMFLILLLSIGS
jgi:SSS family solute:Na+ symporter